MGQYTVEGYLSRRPFNFQIAGDVPSATELQRMRAVLEQEETRWQAESAAATGFTTATPDPEAGTAIGRGLRRGIPQIQSSLGTAAEYAGLDRIGDYLQNAAREREIAILEENPALMDGANFRDVRGLGSALTYAGELVGEQAPLIGGTIGAGALTGGAGALAGLGTAASVGLGTVAGTAAVSGPTLFGSNLERQEAQVAAGELARVDVGAAANAAVAQTGLELLSNLILVGRIPSTLARAIAQNATAEALTEVGQQALERQQAGLPVDSDDAIQEYLDAAVAGATLGAGFGAISRFAPGRGQTEERPEPQATPQAAPLAEEQPGLFDDLPEARAPMRPGQDIVLGGIEPELSPDVRAAVADLFPDEELDLRGGEAAAEQPRLAEVPQPAPRQLELPLPRTETQGELDLVAPRGAQGDLFREGPPFPAEATAQVAPEATPPATPEAPSITIEDLDTLGIPRGAAVYQGVRSGTLANDAAIEAALDRYTRATRDADRAARVRNFVEGRRATPQPRPEETEAQLRAAAEPDSAVDERDGARDEGGGRGDVGGPRPVVDQPPGEPATPAPGGLGDGQRDLDQPDPAAGDVQPTLTPEEALLVRRQLREDYDGAVYRARPKSAERTLDEQLSRLYAEFEQRNAVRPDQRGRPYLRKPMRDWTVFDFMEAKKDMPNEAEFLARVQEVKRDKFQTYEARRIDDTRFVQDQLREVLPETYARSIEDDPIGLVDAAFADENIPEIEPLFSPQQGAEPALTPTEQATADITQAFGALGTGIGRAARQRVADQIQRGDAPTFSRPDSVAAAKAEPRYNLTENPDGSATVIGVQVDEGGPWVGASPEAAPDVDPDTLSAPQRVLDVPLGDTAIEALRAGDIRGALERLPTAISDRTMGKLARRLVPFMDGVTPRIVPANDPRLVARDGTVRPGAYLPGTGELLLNAETGLNPQTLLHETVHAATISVLSNPSHPLSRQIEQIRERAAEVLPAHNYGLQDRFEFVSEGMTNPDFIRDLSYVETVVGDDKVSLGRRFVTAVTNFLRGLVNQPKRPFRPAKTELDNLFESLLAPAAEYRGTGTVIDALYGPGRIQRAKDMLNSLSTRTVEATPKNMAEVRSVLRDVRVPVAMKDTIARWAVPLPFIVEYASRYMPSAPRLKRAMDALHAEQRRLNERVTNSANTIGRAYAKHPDRVKDAERVRMGMSEPGAMFDIRKPYEYYSKYYFEFNVLDDEGNIIGTKRSKAFDNARARNRGMGRFNSNLPKKRSEGRAINPRTEEQLTRQKEIRRIYASLPKEMQDGIKDALALPEYFRAQMQDALRARIGALLDGDTAQVNRVMNIMYSKVFADKLLDGYQAFIRKGDYGMSYEAADPDTGEVVMFKHSFQTPRQRLDARRLLEQAGEDVTTIKFYQKDRGQTNTRDARPSMQFVANVLSAIERTDQPGIAAIRNEILDLVWDAAPETSFVQTFRRRVGTPGYEQDQTLLTLEPNAGSAVENITDANSRLAYQVAGIKYGNAVEELKAQIDLEHNRFVDAANQNSTNPATLDADLREAAMYRQILLDYSRAPLQKNAPWTATVNSGLYALTLGFNVSSVAIQLFHIPMFIATFQSPKYGTRNVMQGLGIASRYLTKSGRQRTLERIGADGTVETMRENVGWWNASLRNYDYANDAKVRWLSPLNAAMEQNGFYTDSVALEMAGDIYDMDAPGRRTAGSLVRKGAAVSGLMQHQVERGIRETATMNAYIQTLKQTNPVWKAMSTKQFVRALENGQINPDPDVAAQAAQDAITEGEFLNGSIYSSSSPLQAQKDGWNVIYLFKKFGLSMMNLLWHTAMRGWGSAGDGRLTAEERRVAKLQFASMAGSIGLISGAAGLPLFGAIANLYNLLKDDEDEDFETLVRTGVLGEFGLNGAANYLTGLNISPRVGMSGIFYREPFNAENNTPLTNLIEGLGGPAVGMFNKYTDRALQLFQDGEIWRGTEAVMPSFVANGLRTARYILEDGPRTMRGDAIIEDIGPFHLAGQFFGFQPAEYAQQLAMNAQQRGIDNAINRTRSRLLSQLYRAHRARDFEEYRDVMAAIQEYNREAPTFRQRITRDTIRRSLDSHRATTARTVNGIAYSTTNERYLRQLATDWGPVSFMDRG